MSILPLSKATVFLYPQTAFLLCVHVLLKSLPHQINTPVLTLMTLFNLNYFLKGGICKYSHIGGEGFKHINFGKDEIQSIGLTKKK
jgi:hypothetical protein